MNFKKFIIFGIFRNPLFWHFPKLDSEFINFLKFRIYGIIKVQNFSKFSEF